MNDSAPAHPFLGCDLAAVAAAMDDLAASVLVLEPTGHIHYANRAASLWLCGEPILIANNGLRQFLPKPAADERLALIADVISTRQPVRCVGIMGGRLRVWKISTFTPQDAPACAIMVCRPVDAIGIDKDLLQDPAVRRSAFVDLGDLAMLNYRELEILRLVGRGLTTPEMGVKLGRSRKTIEGRRGSLGQKLRARNRVEVARLAIESGLNLLSDQEFAAIEPLCARLAEPTQVEVKPRRSGLHSRSSPELPAHEP